jgi:hypothetical protein
MVDLTLAFFARVLVNGNQVNAYHYVVDTLDFRSASSPPWSLQDSCFAYRRTSKGAWAISPMAVDVPGAVTMPNH